MTEPYDHKLIALADTVAQEKGLRLMHGVYVGTTDRHSRHRPNTNTSA